MTGELPLAPHHQRAIDKTIAHFSADPQVRAIVLAGSIARGRQKESSDVDVMVVLDEAGYEAHRQANRLSECLGNLTDYQGGYIDVKYFPKSFLVAAAERGSEPTRHSFVGTRSIFSRDAEVEPLLTRIGTYPEDERADKMLSFYAGLALSAGFFWGEAQKRNNLYLKTRMAADIVLFATRLILAHNRVLFPCQKWMLDALDKASDQPADLRQRIDAFLETPTNENEKALVETVQGFRDWGYGKDWHPILTRFIEDHEQWWWKRRPNVIEW